MHPLTPRASALYRLLANIMSEPCGPFYMLTLAQQRDIEQTHGRMYRAIRRREDISEADELEVRAKLRLAQLPEVA